MCTLTVDDLNQIAQHEAAMIDIVPFRSEAMPAKTPVRNPWT